MVFSILPVILIMVATYLKGRDANLTGTDDTVGDILLAVAPAVQGLQEGNEISVRKALLAVKATLDAYLSQPAPTPTAETKG